MEDRRAGFTVSVTPAGLSKKCTSGLSHRPQGQAGHRRASVLGLARHQDGRLSGSERPASPGPLSGHWFPPSQMGVPGRAPQQVYITLPDLYLCLIPHPNSDIQEWFPLTLVPTSGQLAGQEGAGLPRTNMGPGSLLVGVK